MNRNRSPFSHILMLGSQFLATILLFSACNNCPDYLLIPEVRRYNPYQLNQTIIFENLNQQKDTFVVTSFRDQVLVEPCPDNANQTFEYGVLDARLESMTTDSLVFRFGATKNNFVYIGFGECCTTDLSFDAVSDTVQLSIEASSFAFAQSEVVNGMTYTDVGTFTPQYPTYRKFNSAKVAIDHGLIAYQDISGTWWFRQ